MDEEALKDAHKLFLETGYKGDLAKFKNLISTNPNALKDAHQLFVNTGYNKSIDDFSTLVGVKKKSSFYINFYHTKSKIGFGKESWFFVYCKTKY